MSLQLNSPYIANTASKNYVSSNGSTLTVNGKSNTQDSLPKEVIVIDDDSDNDENTQNPELLYNNDFPNEAEKVTTQYKNKGNLKVSDFPCITTEGKLYGTDDMVLSNIAVQSDKTGIQLLENTVISPNRNGKQDLYDLYYKEVEEMLSKLDQVEDGSTDVEKADSSNTGDFLCARYGIATTCCTDDDEGKGTIDELNSGAANSAVESAKQRIAERYKLLQPKKSSMEEEVIHEEQRIWHGLGTSVLRFNFCEKSFTGPSRLATHMSKVHSKGYQMETKNLYPEKFRIENYDVFKNSQNGNIHSKEVGVNAFSEKSKKEQGSFTCTLCGMKFVTHYLLKIHYEKHAGEHTFECCYCGKAFEQKTQFYKHLRTHSGGKPYKCYYCSKAFATKSYMDQHLRTHTGEKPYECSYCGKAFTQKSSMDQHVRIHTGEKPYKCSYCDKALAQRSHLDQHLRTHTGEKPYECSYCNKAFARKLHMVQHLRTHTGEKPYECSYCGKAFTQKSSMDQHVRIHTGEKPYKCSYCDKALAQRSHLDQHLRTHTGEKPYECPYCGKVFAQKSSMDQHVRTHTGGKPYECSYCGKTFTQKSNLNQHLRTHR